MQVDSKISLLHLHSQILENQMNISGTKICLFNIWSCCCSSKVSFVNFGKKRTPLLFLSSMIDNYFFLSIFNHVLFVKKIFDLVDRYIVQIPR